MVRKIRKLLISIIYKLFWIFPVNEKKIVFESFWGVVDHDSPGAIYRELIARTHMYDIFWLSIDGIEDIPFGAIVKLGTLSELYHLATAKVWIDNCRKPGWINKRKGQIYIQTWHGGFPVKKSEGECSDKLPDYYIAEAIHDSSMIDYIPTNSKLGIRFFEENFWYKGKILYIGLPRNDIFHKDNNHIKQKVYRYAELNSTYKFLLYAPTFRNDLAYEYNFDYSSTIEVLRQKFGGNWKILIKPHPNSKFRIDSNSENVIDCSNYNDINDLIITANIFVSDYSSCIFDAVEADIPVILYAPDYESYLNERGMNFTYDQFPFPYALTFENFLLQIREFDNEDYDINLNCFVSKYGLIRTRDASRIITDIILDEMSINNNLHRRNHG